MKTLLLFATILIISTPSFAQHPAVNYKEVDLNFVHAGDSIFGKLIIPKGEKKDRLPVIVFVHGSGPEDYSSSGNYNYLWHEFVKAGYACYSWDKPGTGKSQGYWYTQTIYQRADEVVCAMKMLKTSAIIDSSKIGLWGISQAGWVMPLAAEKARPAFVICVSSPVTTVFEQELYRIGSEMAAEGYSREDINKAIAYTQQCKKLITEDKPYSAFLDLQNQIDAYKWSQVVIRGDERVYKYLQVLLREDSVPRLESYHCPVLALWGENDLLVPPKTSSDFFKEKMSEINNPDATVKIIPKADHTLTFNLSGKRSETIRRREMYKDNPSMVFAPGAVELMVEWLQAVGH